VSRRRPATSRAVHGPYNYPFSDTLTDAEQRENPPAGPVRPERGRRARRGVIRRHGGGPARRELGRHLGSVERRPPLRPVRDPQGHRQRLRDPHAPPRRPARDQRVRRPLPGGRGSLPRSGSVPAEHAGRDPGQRARPSPRRRGRRRRARADLGPVSALRSSELGRGGVAGHPVVPRHPGRQPRLSRRELPPSVRDGSSRVVKWLGLHGAWRLDQQPDDRAHSAPRLFGGERGTPPYAPSTGSTRTPSSRALSCASCCASRTARPQPPSASIMSLEWVTGSRLPSSSMRDPLSSWISSTTGTLTRWWTFVVRPARGT
jgi:hypothetical protein